MSDVRVIDEWMDWDVTGAELSFQGQNAHLLVKGISFEARAAALDTVRAQLTEGDNLRDAIEASLLEAATGDLPRGEVLADDVVLVDASVVTLASRAVDVTKSVSALARGSRRVVLVSGTLDFSGESDYDNLSAFGALMVRLNVGQVFAIGRGARSLFLSVGMEGSWDGESRFCENSDNAYDDIRAHIRPGDVVLVLGDTEKPLSTLVARLRADLS